MRVPDLFYWHECTAFCLFIRCLISPQIAYLSVFNKRQMQWEPEGFNQFDYSSTVCESVETELVLPVKQK
jgi:hypothetical protein